MHEQDLLRRIGTDIKALRADIAGLRNHLDLRLTHSRERQTAMRQTMEDLAKAIADYAAKVQAYIDAANANQQTSDQIVAAALAADNAGEDVDFAKMTADLKAAADKVPAPPTPPVTT